MGDIQSEHFHRYLFALRYCEDKEVLDVASGEGYGSALLGQVARSVIGVDVDMASVDFANAHYLNERVSFRRGDAIALPIADASVDVVVSFETIEHLSDHEIFLTEVRRVLRPGGAMLHVDVATQVTRLPLADQVMNHWQVDWNGEPFWTGFSEQDMRAQIVAAGFDPALSFADHLAKATGAWYVFGSRAN